MSKPDRRTWRLYVLSEPQNHRCCYCGLHMIRHQHRDGHPTPRNAMTRDHYEPRVYGGPTTDANMIAACCQCNNLRGELEAEAFYNLLQKWFKRDGTLRERWHTLPRHELRELKECCHQVHEAQLYGRARRHIEFAFRHIDFAGRRKEWALRQRAWT